MNSLLLFTDGACKGNSNVATVQHAAGWGVAAVLGAGPLDEDGLQAPGPLAELCGLVITDPSHPHFLGATVGSNNTAELTAIGEAFKWLAAQCREAERAGGLEHLGGPVVLRYDSDYAAKSVTGEFNGKKNTALIARVRAAYAEAQSALASLRSRRGSPREHSGIRFVHVRGHSGHRWNEHADLLAHRGLSCTLRPDGAAQSASDGRASSDCMPLLAVAPSTIMFNSKVNESATTRKAPLLMDRWVQRPVSVAVLQQRKPISEESTTRAASVFDLTDEKDPSMILKNKPVGGSSCTMGCATILSASFGLRDNLVISLSDSDSEQDIFIKSNDNGTSSTTQKSGVKVVVGESISCSVRCFNDCVTSKDHVAHSVAEECAKRQRFRYDDDSDSEEEATKRKKPFS